MATTHRRLAGFATLVLAGLTALTGCSSTGRGTTQAAPSQATTAVNTAQQAAVAAAQGKSWAGRSIYSGC